LIFNCIPSLGLWPGCNLHFHGLPYWSSFTLFVINMTSQNLPGIAMIKSYGYQPHVNQLVGWTGVAHTIFAPFGCFSINLAAISAAVSLDDQVHPDPPNVILQASVAAFFIF
jgi:benzoate membrane transport protein